MPFHDVIRSQAVRAVGLMSPRAQAADLRVALPSQSSERLLVSATDDFSVELARKILFPWVFGTESTAEEDGSASCTVACWWTNRLC